MPPAIVYDEAAERTVVNGGWRLAAYDATADRWEVLVELSLDHPAEKLPLPMVYDPVNRRLVGLGGGAIVEQGGVVAFDLVTRQWTVLLEPSEAARAELRVNLLADPRVRPEGEGK